MKLRFAPSPTGYLHIGNVRTLLVTWLYAQKHKATFYLRFDDTDRERSKAEYEDAILEDMAWLGLAIDAQVRQSDRFALYAAAAEKLKASGRLYPCYETKQELDFKRKRSLSQGKPPVYDRAALHLTPQEISAFEAEGRKPHWRFKLNACEITWTDMAHGSLTFQGDKLSDPILIREDGTPVFTLSGMVDDMEMGITHIIRGDDHITNTAIQLQIMEALGGDLSSIHLGHIPLVTDAKGDGLSKRLGSLGIRQLREDGFEPLALANYLSHLGVAEEVPLACSLEDLADHFDLTKLGRSSPKFSDEDLQRTNTRLLHQMTYAMIMKIWPQDLTAGLTQAFWETIKGNLEKRTDLIPYRTICFGQVPPIVTEQDYLREAQGALPPTPWNEDTWGAWTQALKEKTGRKGKDLFLPLRLALTAMDHGPEMKKILPFLSRDVVLKRLEGQTA